MGAAMGWRGAVVALVWSAAVPAAGLSQSTLERSPNLEGGWSPAAGVVQFNFLHRFQVVGEARKVLSYPTFVVAAGAPGRVALGARYAPNSLLVSARPNEWEVFGRWAALRQARGAPLDVSVQASHNTTAGGADGELLAARRVGSVRGLVAVRGYSSFLGEDAAAALVAGASIRLSPHASVAADVAGVLGSGSGPTAWSGGLQLQIPYTPHTLSLHASNVTATTLHGSVVGTDEVRWGFEFTVSLTVRRYLAGRSDRPVVAADADADGAARVGAEVAMDNSMSFLPDTVRIAVGEAVRWRNAGDIVHTVTADPRLAGRGESVRLPPGARPFDSGDLRPGEEFVHLFTKPGVYAYFCVPHELAGMVGVILVE